jgi:hypothetical protein
MKSQDIAPSSPGRDGLGCGEVMQAGPRLEVPGWASSVGPPKVRGRQPLTKGGPGTELARGPGLIEGPRPWGGVRESATPCV